ncbi:MAG: FimV/HubP family polar landmark protein, partial [Gammaproteobacteria bacterium]
TPQKPAAMPAAAAPAVAATAATAAGSAAAEDLLETRDDLRPFEGRGDPEQFQRTMEATAEQLAAAPEEDPLEEVNVYLAYERFDQAEELVRNVIAKYPFEHKYKLRLLEIYYSANNKPAYENSARELLDAVGDASPLWASALAMWNEMSPERSLFAPPSAAEPAVGESTDSASAFVDITSDIPGDEATVVQPAEGDDLLASTQVGLTNDFTGTSTLDFDLGAGETAEPMIDLTAPAELPDADDVLDLTETAGEMTKDTDVFDVSGENLLGLADTVENAAAEVAQAPRDFDEFAATAFDDTAPGPLEPDSAEAATVGGFVEEQETDFDISDTVAPAGARLTETTPPAASGDLELDFDIEGLAAAAEPVESTAAEAAPALEDLDLTLDSDLEIGVPDSAEADADLDLSLQDTSELDFDLGAPASTEPPGESEVEFDLALQDTTDFESLSIDDTLELPKSSTARAAGMQPVDTESESLEDLTRSMEASISGLDLDDDKDSILDLSLEPGDAEALDLDFGLDDLGELNGLDTLALDPDELRRQADGVTDRTVALPRDGEAEIDAGLDETDTKLNLAKAYIELGDGEGARAILNEVVTEGTASQQEEARRLLSQLV